jgi:hypothetical protein
VASRCVDSAPTTSKRSVTKVEARAAVAGYIDRYNPVRRHSSCQMKSPIGYEASLAVRAADNVTGGEGGMKPASKIA